MAENLNRISAFTLPPIPTNVNVVSIELDARRRAKISWHMRIPHNHCDEHIEYIVEARMHVGNSFSKYKLGQWFVIKAENYHFESMHSYSSKYVPLITFLWTDFVFEPPFISLKTARLSCWVLLQIGRFYEFRVLAVNGNGTRGYSETAIFQLNESKLNLNSHFYARSILTHPICC